MTTYEEIEKAQARRRLQDICDAVDSFPEAVDPALRDTDLLELLQLARFAGKEIHLAVLTRSENSPTR